MLFCNSSLHGEGKFLGSTRPDIILLDLNLPNKDGREVLREIKEDEPLPISLIMLYNLNKDIIFPFFQKDYF
jgi:CheY-like chemotaxis protein